jgi:hypothetical protein
MSWRVYQSVFSSEVFATTTSRRTPSTSCAYQSGKVSLSPTVISTPYGSTELSRSRAKSAVSVWPAREAFDQFVNSGMSASASTGAAMTSERRAGRSITSRPTVIRSSPISAASESQMATRPSDAQTPQAEKLQRKK